jgi:hypothetical protein
LRFATTLWIITGSRVQTMAIYARRPWRLAGQVSADVFVLAWAVSWWLVAGVAKRAILSLAGPARDAAGVSRQLSIQFHQAAEEAGRVPRLGDRLRQPLDAASASLTHVVDAAGQQATSIERLGTLMGWLVFLIPVTLLIALWLPARIRFFLHARAAQHFVDSVTDLDMLALRAVTNQPLHVLARISADPVGAWRMRDATVIHKLAEVELRRSGLRMPTLSAREPSTKGEPAGEG